MTDVAKEVAAPKEETNVEVILALAVRSATANDREIADSILSLVTSSEPQTSIIEFTPGAAAILLAETNKHNRELRYPKALGYSKQMKNGQWKLQGQGFQWYDTGNLGDGQHRLLGMVLSGVTLKFTVFTGLEEAAVDTLDLCTKRTAADAAALEGIQNSKLKEATLKSANTYLSKIDRRLPFDSVHTLKLGIRQYDQLLDKAIAVAEAAATGVVTPTIHVKFATAVAFVLLVSDWDVAEVTPLLKEFQSGVLREGASDHSPLFVAGDYLDKKESTPSQQWLIIIKALIMAKEGVTAVKSREFTSIKTKPAPDPKLLIA